MPITAEVRKAWSALPLRMKGMVAIALPLLSLLMMRTATIVIDAKQKEATNLHMSTAASRASANDFLGPLVDAETAIRGYALTGDLVFLEPLSSLRDWPKALDRAIEQSSVASRGGIAPDELRTSGGRALEGIQNILTYLEQRRGGIYATPDAELNRLLSDGKLRMDNFRTIIARVKENQTAYLRENDNRLASLRHTTTIVNWIALLWGLGGCFLSIYLLQWSIIARIYTASAAARILPTGRRLPATPESADEIGLLMAGIHRASELLNERERDLTAKNQELADALTAAREASAHKSRFLANMSHELRTPLNGIIGFTEMIHDGRAGNVNEMQKDFLNDSLHSARHLLNLINDILDLERVESGHLALSPESFDMNTLITETLGEVRAIAASKDIVLASELESDAGAVFLDRQKTRQILLNLMMNAIKFTPDKGLVTARLRSVGHERVLVEIEDTGIGISETDQLRLFREFEQLETSASKHFQGTGLGLALTRRLVEAQGGEVSVSSQVGVGSVFSVSLPASSQTFHADPDPLSPRWDETILVVEGADHDPEVPQSIVLALRGAGHTVEESSSIEDALDRLERHRYRAVVTSLMLSRGTGFDLVQEIRRREHHSDLPVIIATGNPEGLDPQGFMVHDALTRAARPEDIAATLGRVSAAGLDRQVLVVDDDPNIHKLVRTALRGTGLEAVCCADGESGLRALRFRRPSAMVVDLMMPGLDGFSFIARVQDIPEMKTIPLIVWTNLDPSAEQLKGLRRGVSKIIYKSDGGINRLIRELEKQLVPSGLEPAA